MVLFRVHSPRAWPANNLGTEESVCLYFCKNIFNIFLKITLAWLIRKMAFFHEWNNFLKINNMWHDFQFCPINCTCYIYIYIPSFITWPSILGEQLRLRCRNWSNTVSGTRQLRSKNAPLKWDLLEAGCHDAGKYFGLRPLKDLLYHLPPKYSFALSAWTLTSAQLLSTHVLLGWLVKVLPGVHGLCWGCGCRLALTL